MFLMLVSNLRTRIETSIKNIVRGIRLEPTVLQNLDHNIVAGGQAGQAVVARAVRRIGSRRTQVVLRLLQDTVAVIGKGQDRPTAQADIARVPRAIRIQVIVLRAGLGRLLVIAEVVARIGLAGRQADGIAALAQIRVRRFWARAAMPSA